MVSMGVCQLDESVYGKTPIFMRYIYAIGTFDEYTTGVISILCTYITLLHFIQKVFLLK